MHCKINVKLHSSQSRVDTVNLLKTLTLLSILFNHMCANLSNLHILVQNQLLCITAPVKYDWAGLNDGIS
jgi:hypothetical protein